VRATTTRPKIVVTADGAGVVSHVGSRLLADVADRTTLTAELAEALAGLRKPRVRHDPGRVQVDLAVAVAGGARTILAGRGRSLRSPSWPINRRCSGRWRIAHVPESAWADAVDADGGHRDGARLAEITELLPPRALLGYPEGVRVIVRRERPHPGAQLNLMETRDGWRYTAFATDTRAGQLAWLDARHRAHARVEDRIRVAKDTGLDLFPSRTFQINQAWLAVVMLATDLTAWTQQLLLDGDLAKAEPKTLRYRLPLVAARLTRGQRRTWVRIQQSWPWAPDLTIAFARLAALPVPAG
jgi:hypothetical protein